MCDFNKVNDKVNAEKIYNDIKFSFSKAKNQTAHMFTPKHVKYNCKITYNDSFFSHSYQCNPYYYNMSTKEVKKDFLTCLLQDAFAFLDSRNIQDFADEFGYDFYEDKKEVERIFHDCERTYTKLSYMFNEIEMNELLNYLNTI